VSVRIVCLGAGDAFGAGGRCMSAYLVRAPGSTLLLDCGPTALLSLKRHGLKADSIDAIVISHLHGDHFAGVPFFFLEYRYEQRRTRPLTIAGPPGTAQRVEAVFGAMYKNLASQPLPFPVDYVELQPDVPRAIAGAEILPFRVPHQENDVSFGFRVELSGRSLLYSGDSGWTEAFVRHAAGTQLFICECCYFETRVDFHLDYPRIAANRPRLGCERLILTHIGREVLARLSDVSEEVADDGLQIDI